MIVMWAECTGSGRVATADSSAVVMISITSWHNRNLGQLIIRIAWSALPALRRLKSGLIRLAENVESIARNQQNGGPSATSAIKLNVSLFGGGRRGRRARTAGLRAAKAGGSRL